MEQMSLKQKIYPWVIVVAMSFMAAATMELAQKGIGQFYPLISTEIGSPVSFITLGTTGSLIAVSICAPIAGQLYTRIDSRIVLSIYGLVCFGGFALMSVWAEAWQYWISITLVGAGMSGVGIIGAPIFISNWFKKRTGFAIGCYGTGVGVLSIILMPVIALFIDSLGFRQAALVMALVDAILFFPFAWFVVRFKPEQMGLKPYGYVEGEAEEEKKKIVTGPGVPYVKAFKSAAFWMFLIAACLMTNHNGWMRNWPTIVQFGWGYTVIFSGFVMSAQTFGQLLSPVFGWIADRIGAVKGVTITLSLIIAGFLILLFFNGFEFMVLFGVFLFGFQSVNMKILIPLVVRELFGQKEHAKIYSTIYGIGNASAAFSTSLVAFIGEATGSYDITMVVGAIFTGVILVLVWGSFIASKKLVWED